MLFNEAGFVHIKVIKRNGKGPVKVKNYIKHIKQFVLSTHEFCSLATLYLLEKTKYKGGSQP